MAQPVSDQVRLAPDRAVAAAVLVAALGALPLGLSSPFFAPVLLLPVLALVWVLRARVSASSDGVEVCNGFAVHRYAWADVDRFAIPRRGPVVLHPVQGRPVRLTAMSRQDVRRLTVMAGAS